MVHHEANLCVFKVVLFVRGLNEFENVKCEPKNDSLNFLSIQDRSPPLKRNKRVGLRSTKWLIGKDTSAI